MTVHKVYPASDAVAEIMARVHGVPREEIKKVEVPQRLIDAMFGLVERTKVSVLHNRTK